MSVPSTGYVYESHCSLEHNRRYDSGMRDFQIKQPRCVKAVVKSIGALCDCLPGYRSRWIKSFLVEV